LTVPLTVEGPAAPGVRRWQGGRTRPTAADSVG